MSAADTPTLTPTGAGYQLAGVLTFATVPELARRQAAPSGAVDLSGVTRADSAGLALLLDWLAAAHAGGSELTYSHLPSQLAAIARVSGIAEVLDHDHE